MGLINNIKTLNTRVKSSMKLLKKNLINQNALVTDIENMSTIPEEIDSIRILDHDPIEFFANQVYDMCADHTSFSEEIPARFVLNPKTNIGLCFLFYMGDAGNRVLPYTKYYQFDMNRKYPFSTRKLCEFPTQANGATYEYDALTTQVVTLDEYFIIRFKLYDGKSIDLYSKDGIKWSSNMNDIINNYVFIDGKYCLMTDHTIGLLTSDGHLYEYDILSHKMILNDNYSKNVNISAYHNRSLSASTDAIHFHITEKNKDDSCDLMMTYSSRLTPLEHLYFSLPSSLKDLVVKWVDMVCSNRNTILLMGVSVTNTFIVCEIGMSYSNDAECNPIISITDTGLLVKDALKDYYDKNTLEESGFSSSDFYLDHPEYLVGKLVPRGTTYSIYTLGATYILNDGGEWNQYISHTLSNQFSESDIISDNWIVGYANQKLCKFSFRYGYTIERESIIKNVDVPEGKTYLSPSGNVSFGVASNSYYSIFSSGKICNIDLKENEFLSNPMLYDKRGTLNSNLTKIIYYCGEYLFFLIEKKHILILRSKDGYTWNKGYESNVFSVPELEFSIQSLYDIRAINGNIYMIRPGIGVSEIIRFDIDNDHISLTKTDDILKDLVDNSVYLYHTGEYPVVAVSDDNIEYHIIAVKPYCNENLGNIISGPIVGIDIVEGCDDELLIRTSENQYFLSGGKLYISNVIEPVVNYHYRKVIHYDDYVIIVRESISHTEPFVLIYKLSVIDETMSSVALSSFESIAQDLFIRDYYPLVTVRNNLLLIDDYRNINPSFVIDMDNDMKICRINDSRYSNSPRYIQYCNGILFTINSLLKCDDTIISQTTHESGSIDVAYANGRYISISENSTILSYTEDGRVWVTGSSYGEKVCQIIQAIDDIVLISQKHSATNEYYLSIDNGISWTVVNYPDTWIIQNIEVEEDATFGRQFVAFIKYSEEDTTNAIFYSVNGIDWMEVPIFTTTSGVNINGWRDITCDNVGTWVAIAENKNVLSYSHDAITWLTTLLPRIQKWSAVCYGSGIFMAIATNSEYGAMSTDGINWEEIKLPSSREWIGCAAGMYDNRPVFVAIASNSKYAAIGDSPRNMREIDMGVDSREFVRIIYQNNRFVALAANSGYIYYSSDGIVWSKAALPESANWRYLLYGDGVFIAIDITCTKCATSITAKDWSLEEVDTSKPLRFIDYHNDKFVVFELNSDTYNPDDMLSFAGTSDIYKEWITSAFHNNHQCYASTDGMIIQREIVNESTWTAVDIPIAPSDTELDKPWLVNDLPGAQDWIAVAKHDNIVIVINRNEDTIGFSEDNGDTWVTGLLPIKADWRDIVWGKDRFIIIASHSGVIAHSKNGYEWEIIEFENFHPIHITAMHYRVLVCGKTDDGVTLFKVTYDGITWKDVESDVSFTPIDGANIFDRYIYLCQTKDEIAISPNGFDEFMYKHFDSQYDWRSIAVNPDSNIFVIAVANSSIILRSEDLGDTWAEIELAANLELEWNKIIYLHDRFILLGNNTNIGLWSMDGLEWVSFELPYSGNWVDAYYDDLKYNIIVEDNAYYAYSYDCIYWYKLSNIGQMIYGNGIYVAFDKSYNIGHRSTIFVSSDTTNWNMYKTIFNDYIVDIAYGNSKFVLITAGKSNFVYESIDGKTWTKRYISYLGEKSSIAYGSAGFVITEKDRDRSYLIESSLPSKMYNLPASMDQQGFIFYNGFYILFDSITRSLYVSRDMEDWLNVLDVSVDIVAPWKLVVVGDVAVFSYGYTTIYTSIDGLNWTRAVVDTPSTSGIIGDGYLNNKHCPIILDDTTDTFNVLTDVTNGVWDAFSFLIGEAGTNKAMCAGKYTTILLRDNSIYTFRFNSEFNDSGVINTKMIEHYDLVDCKFYNGRFIVSTNSNVYYVSYDGCKWVEYSLNYDFNIKSILIDGDLCVLMLETDSTKILSYTNDLSTWNYIDFNETYGIDSGISIANHNIWILRNDAQIEKVELDLNYIALISSGLTKTMDQRIQPKRNEFSRGSFKTGVANEYTKVILGFTPQKVIIHSKASVNGKYYHAVISNTNDLYNQMDIIAHGDASSIILEKNGNEIVSIDPGSIDKKPQIIANGFLMICDVSEMYFEYYAIS